MRCIGIIPADRLPSSSIGLRSMEFNRLKFARTIAYTSARATVVRQYQGVEVAKSIEELRRLVENEPDEAVVYVNGYFKLDSETMQVFGTPGENEVRCIAGKLFAGSTPLGDKSLLKVMEYDRRRNVSRYMKGDSGDIRVDVADMRGPVVMDARCLRKLLESGNDWTRTIAEFQDTVDASGASIVCMDPMKHGVRWHPGLIPSEKKPTSVIVRGTVVKETKDAKLTENIAPKPVIIEHDASLPVLTVVVLTHNRTAVACKCVEAMCKGLKYSGDIRFCVCDDRSEKGHVEALSNTLRSCGVFDFSVCRSTAERYGLGASMNNGLSDAFSRSDVVLTMEDDFLLVREFDVTPFVRLVLSDDIAGIRLAHVATLPRKNGHTITKTVPSRFPGMLKVVGGDSREIHLRFVFNNQVMLRHKRVYDAIGPYRENCDPDMMEQTACAAFNAKTDSGHLDTLNVLYPASLKRDSLDNGLFRHIGESTMNHGFKTPEAYLQLNSEALDRRIRTKALKPIPFFRIVIPAYNVEKYMKRCIESIAQQTFSDFVVCVCDDMSSDGTYSVLSRLAESYDWLKVFRSDSKLFNGGARNKALSMSDSEYTMYIDADDYLADKCALERVHSALVDACMPDAARLSFVAEYKNGTRKPVYNLESTPEELAKSGWPMPWCTCVRSDKVVQFPEDINAQVDVVQNLLQADNVETVCNVAGPVVVYTSENPNSVSKRIMKNNVFVSWFRAAAHVMESTGRHPWFPSARATIMNYWIKRFRLHEQDILALASK